MHDRHGDAPSTTARTNYEAPAGDAARGFGEQANQGRVNSRCDGIADQATLTIEGEAYALAYLLRRLRADAAHPDELALILSFLPGAMLRGACRLLEKALMERRHA